ncbi:hypothetical protein INP83_12945 [Mucilaginibacter sp. 21P]|uniref:hypothetical protein n=1 Tax=Mucilaginibacter sp. 21P TaxID=2778902 RepID=UPI001C579139|nr:hypothetical protein [Mucilaginibacter sp. 21P]QXV64004.1 hypothetical protein INP83_12945 [Mucilaginibacter sp. 21P]
MKTILRFEFDQQLFYPEYQGNRNIILEDPSHVPNTGDAVDLEIGEFFEDLRVVEAFQELTEGQLLIAERLNTRYTRDHVEILVVLYREDVFKTQFPHLSGQLSA